MLQVFLSLPGGSSVDLQLIVRTRLANATLTLNVYLLYVFARLFLRLFNTDYVIPQRSVQLASVPRFTRTKLLSPHRTDCVLKFFVSKLGGHMIFSRFV